MARKTSLIPHRKVDGDLLFTDEIFGDIYERIIANGYGEVVFYSGLKSKFEWIDYCKKPGVAVFILADEKPDVLAAVWLDMFRDKTARINYCTFKVGFRDIVSMGKEVIQELLHKTDENDEYILDELIGYTPKSNKKGIKFALKIGAQVVGTLKKGVWIAKEQRSAPCLVTSYERLE